MDDERGESTQLSSSQQDDVTGVSQSQIDWDEADEVTQGDEGQVPIK